MSEFVEFPKWKYKERKWVQGKTGVIVNSAEEEEALGPGWADSPTKAPDREAEQAEIRRGYRESFKAAVNNPAEQVRIHFEYKTLHPKAAAADDSWHLEITPLIPTLQTQVALDLTAERQAEDRERSVIRASPAPPQTQISSMGKGTASTDSLIPVAASPEQRAATVARIIAELNTLEPQMYGEASYEELKEHHPDFLTFKVSEQRSDLKLKLVNIQRSTRHIRLAQELAAHYHGIVFETMKSDWKHHKPENFPGQKYRKTSRKKRKNKA